MYPALFAAQAAASCFFRMTGSKPLASAPKTFAPIFQSPVLFHIIATSARKRKPFLLADADPAGAGWPCLSPAGLRQMPARLRGSLAGLCRPFFCFPTEILFRTARVISVKTR
ncbi:MAG: hypothetical protein DBY36_04695 [Clostridiales bacterium]|nr:MAG: hypothetical protein DBY36_04695 [Clostridiales bacterium]